MVITRHIFDTYLSVIEGSVGANMFRHFWADFDGELRDTMQDGWTSSAFFVSSILMMFSTITSLSSTVKSLEEKLVENNWKQVKTPEAGDILIWEESKPTPKDLAMAHVGFYIGEKRAISASWRAKTPIEHDWLFRESKERKIVSIYRGKHLMPDNIKTLQ